MRKASLKKPQKTISFLSLLPYLMLLLLGLLTVTAFFAPGLPITHDGKDHVARIANFYQNLSQGVIIPRWAENLNWGYGHPILMFLYPFPSYFASFFHFLGFSFIDSVKTVFVVSFILSGWSMYLWVSRILNKYAGFIAAVLYMFAPYRFVDLHVRGAIGEHVAFIFPPLVLYFLFKISEKTNFLSVILGGIALAGFILSHNAISLMFLPVFLLYGVFLFLQTKYRKTFVIYSCLLVGIGFSLSAFFWIPALLEGKYTLRGIVTVNEYAKHYVAFSDFIYGAWSFGGTDVLSKQVGIAQWMIMLGTTVVTIVWYRKKNTLWQLSLGAIVIFLLSLFIMMPPSKVIWDYVKILQNFQFPWRFLSVIVFITAFSGGLVIYALPQKVRVYIVIVVTLLSVFLTASYWGVNGYLNKSDVFFSGIYDGTTDTGESAPIWSVRFMEKRAKARIEIIEGEGKIIEESRQVTRHVYEVSLTERSRFRENTLYFPGWKVRVDNVVVQPEFQDPKNRGLMTFYVEKGTHKIEIRFEDTKVRQLANAISLSTLVIIGFFCIMKVLKIWKRSR